MMWPNNLFVTPLVTCIASLVLLSQNAQKLLPDKIFCFYGYVTPRPSQYRRSNVSLRLFILASL